MGAGFNRRHYFDLTNPRAVKKRAWRSTVCSGVGPRDHQPLIERLAEGWLQSVRQECLDHFVVFGADHLRYILGFAHKLGFSDGFSGKRSVCPKTCPDLYDLLELARKPALPILKDLKPRQSGRLPRGRSSPHGLVCELLRKLWRGTSRITNASSQPIIA